MRFLAQRSRRSGCRGVTLLELVVAVAVSAMTVTMIFAVFLHVNQGFGWRLKMSHRVGKMTVVKAKIDRAVRDIGYVELCEPTAVGYRRIGEKNVVHRLAFVDGKVQRNNETVCEDVAGFRVEITDRRDSRVLLLWEAALGSGDWVAGARVVEMVQGAHAQGSM